MAVRQPYLLIASLTRWPQPDRAPSGDDALASLTLVADLRDWLDEAEPRLIAATAAGVTWQQLAGVLRVNDRRAAQRRAARISVGIGRYWS